DILLWENRVIWAPNLIVPHPGMHLRRFVLVPLCELAPEWRHPLIGDTMKYLLKTVPDDLIVEPVLPDTGQWRDGE
ncbi:2-amino-4-hydroxy-6-hydroxymethyldihydropteridine diphosphokinase, partial [bacterium]|nr:2-amino-4-hydroxy-6-hydroxymethyldihydropteridine diphosphokinase [candidate division CSSED10-310 bacterium]